ncbi:MAG: type IV toxin-antitoxin system AbiEi family antitoxin [Holosporales bacterium]|nr:type IV toxin-antitoxin system AbiEi family antitoxin [Holosporales bacterium]
MPADHLISFLMVYWKKPYYVGLLSAASLHGASHQALQVM